MFNNESTGSITPPSISNSAGIELLETMYATLYLEYLASNKLLLSTLGLSSSNTLAEKDEAVKQYIWDNFNAEGLSGSALATQKAITR